MKRTESLKKQVKTETTHVAKHNLQMSRFQEVFQRNLLKPGYQGHCVSTYSLYYQQRYNLSSNMKS